MADSGGFPTITNADKESVEAKRKAIAARLGGQKPAPAQENSQN